MYKPGEFCWEVIHLFITAVSIETGRREINSKDSCEWARLQNPRLAMFFASEYNYSTIDKKRKTREHPLLKRMD